MVKLRDFTLRFRVENTTFEVRVFPNQNGLLVDNDFREAYTVDHQTKKVSLVDDLGVAGWAEGEMNNGDGFDMVRTLEKLLTDHLFCPHCGTFAGEGKFQDNGCPTTSFDYTQLCLACEEQWSPNE